MLANLSSTIVTDSLDGQRLDGALSLFLPDAGIRTRRRLFESHTILVNGIPCSKGYTVHTGDTILLVEKTVPEKEERIDMDLQYAETIKKLLYIVHEDAQYAAIYKPGGMHTASISGKENMSLENELPALFVHHINEGNPCPKLVNRLDYLTSGMVIVAKTNEAAEKFRAFENHGAVEKLYILLVEGAVATPLQATSKLHTSKRKITKVLPEEDTDPLRHTTFLPLLETVVPDSPAETATLLMAAISKGARHQIRAHITSLGHPIIGDPLYGDSSDNAPTHDDNDIMYLHHYQVEIDSFSAMCPPDWKNWNAFKSSIPVK